jgi:hypothetical protein
VRATGEPNEEWAMRNLGGGEAKKWVTAKQGMLEVGEASCHSSPVSTMGLSAGSERHNRCTWVLTKL